MGSSFMGTPADLLGGRYQLQDELGRGGMALVHRAIDQATGATVAVKVLRADTVVPDPQARFDREVRLMRAIRHPHCVRLLDAGNVPVSYAVLEFIEGADLRDAARRVIPADQVLELTLQLLGGLGQVHASRIVHRDVKAENIMLSRRPDGSDRLVLVDFGAAVVMDPRVQRGGGLTGVDQVLGTPSIMGPEQLCGMPATQQSDLYAVGVLMYEMLTGRAAFDDGSFTEVLAAKTERLPELPGSLAPAVTWLVHSLLAPAPEARPKSCAEAIEAVTYARQALRQSGATSTWIDLLEPTA